MNSTTINIKTNVLNKIEILSKTLKISKSETIKQILWHCNEMADFQKCFLRLTSYQSCEVNDSWTTFHIIFSDLEVNTFLFLRFRFRISLSKLLAIGVELFKREIAKKNKRTDSYTYSLKTYINLTKIDTEIFNLERQRSRIQLE